MQRFGAGLERVVIAEVRGMRAHPKRDKLRWSRCSTARPSKKSCAARPNVPAPGGRVVLAQLGAKLPNGMEIAERDLGGVVSRGMLCSEVELGAGSDASRHPGAARRTARPAPGTPRARRARVCTTPSTSCR